MSWLTPKKMMIIGLSLLILGVLFPFLMVLQVLESTFFLNFFSYACQVTGLFLGVYGILSRIKINRNLK